MGRNPVIFDISSDEEPAFGNPEEDNHDWLSEVLGAVDKQMLHGDSDEVVFVGEVNPRNNSKSTVKDTGSGGNSDDCIVLEGDPDKPPDVATDSKEDSDELIVVGEKGQVACRDFPHPRHDCAMFPFGSTPHEKHCELCHCFVCDTRAPCAFWGSGTSSNEHCHANNKSDAWKTLRKNFRLGINAPLQAAKVPNPSPAMPVPQVNPAPHSHITRLLPNCRPHHRVTRPVVTHSGNPVLQNQLLRSSIIHGCSPSTRLGIPSMTNQVRSRPPGAVWGNNPVQHHSMPQQVIGVRNTVIWKVHGCNGLGSPLVPSSTVPKRIDTGATSAVKQSTSFSADSIASHATGYRENVTQATASNDRYFNELLELVSVGNSGTYVSQGSSQPHVETFFTGTASSEPSFSGLPVAQSNNGQLVSPPQNESQAVSIEDFADLDFGWVNDFVQSGEQPSNNNFQCQTWGSTNEQQLPSEANGSDEFLFNELDLQDLYFDNQPVPVGVAEGSVSLEGAELTVMSPELLGFDAGMLLFDF